MCILDSNTPASDEALAVLAYFYIGEHSGENLFCAADLFDHSFVKRIERLCPFHVHSRGHDCERGP